MIWAEDYEPKWFDIEMNEEGPQFLTQNDIFDFENETIVKYGKFLDANRIHRI